jgi:chromosome partitioning protein
MITAIAISKGGCGKTATAANLAAGVGEMGGRVLAIDLDGSTFALTRAFGHSPATAPATVFEVMTGTVELPDAIISDAAPGVDLLAARRELASLELQLVSEMSRERVLSRALAAHAGAYDAVFIDCAPTLSLLTVNALFAADQVLVPVSLQDAGSVQGAAELAHAVERARTAGAHAHVRACVRVKADPRRIAARAIDNALAGLGLPVAATEIPLSAAFDTAGAQGRPLILSEPGSRGAWAYRRLADELNLIPTTESRIAA